VEKLTELLSIHDVEKLVENLIQKPINNEAHQPNREKRERCVTTIGAKKDDITMTNILNPCPTRIYDKRVMQPNIPRPSNKKIYNTHHATMRLIVPQ
jgi:hypothetical protein